MLNGRPRAAIDTMDEFIHRKNLSLFEKRLENPTLVETERKIILKLLAEAKAKRAAVLSE